MIRSSDWFFVAGLIWIAAPAFGADESLETSGVLRLPVERNLAPQLAAVEQHLSRQETALAAALLERLWLDERHKLVEDQGRVSVVRERVLRLSQQLPDREQRRFWEQLAAADGNSDDDLQIGAPTRGGYLALQRQALRLRDRGELNLAVAALEQAARHPAATPNEVLTADLLRLDLLTELSGPNAMSAWLMAASPETREQTITVAGEQTTVEAWLKRRDPTDANREIQRVTLDRPLMQTRWEWTGNIPAELMQGLRKAGSELRAQGLIPISAQQPLIIGQKIVVPTIDGLACLDAETGQVLWRTVNRAAAERMKLALQQQQNPLFSGKLISALAQQAQLNTLWGALSHDETTVYQIVEPAAAGEPGKTQVGSALEAVDLASGEKRWRVGGGKSTENSVRQLTWNLPGAAISEAAAELFVCGPPLVLGQRFYLLCEQASELHFVAVNRETLEVEWSQLIGSLLPDAARAAPRTNTAAPLIWTGRHIVVGTNCGVIAAVDPVARTIAWITRSPIELWSLLRPELSPTDAIAAAALRSWRQAGIVSAGGKLICLSPDSPALQVLAEANGALVSSIPRGQGLCLLGATEQQVMVLEPNGVRAHDPATGNVLWQTVLGEIRGRGTVIGTRCLQPLADGSVAVLDLADGRRLPGAIHSVLTWGNLTPLPDGWLSSDEFQIRYHPDLNEKAIKPSTILEQARRDLDAGEFAAVRTRLDSVNQDEALSIRRDAALAELHFHPEHAAEIKPRLLAISTTREAQGEAHGALAEAFLQQRAWRLAVAECLDGLELGLSDDRMIRGEATRRVRWDRVFQGQLAAALREVDAAGRIELEALLAERWQSARDALDPFAVQQLEQRWRTFRWTRGRLTVDADAIFLGTSLLSRELALLSAAECDPAAAGVPVRWKLSQDWRAAGFPQDADDLARQLLLSIPGALVAAETTARQQFAEEDLDSRRFFRRLNFGPEDVWPRRSPRITPSRDATDDDVLQTVIPIEAPADGSWDRLDVTLNRQGRLLRFSGDGQQGSWTVAIPSANSSLQEFPLTYRGWGWGRTLIVRIGPLLLAVAPWNEQGEPVANVIWSLNLQGAGSPPQDQLVVERVPSKWKRAQETYRILDHFGREVGFVGPVRPGYLCYQQLGKLIAVETQTGRQLWERWDIAPGVVPLGDEEHVLLWSPELDQCELLDAADGRTIRMQSNPAARNDVWHEAHGAVWTGQADRELTIRCRDLIRQRTQWERTFPKDSSPIALDDRMGAVVDPRGVLHLIELQTGVTRDEPLTVELPPAIERILVSRDEARWYLGFSGPVAQSFEWLAAQQGIINSYRRPLLQGPLIAIDRATRQVVWTRDVAGEPWMLDQNRTSPVLTQIFKLPPPNMGQGIGEGVLRLIDKRTGRDLFTHRDLNLLAYFALETHPALSKFEVRTKSVHFQVDYSPEDKE